MAQSQQQGCTEYFICILFSPSSRLNSVFVFGQILMPKISRIRTISTAPSPLVVPAFSLKHCCLSSIMPTRDALWHFLFCSLSRVCCESLSCSVSVTNICEYHSFNMDTNYKMSSLEIFDCTSRTLRHCAMCLNL